MKVRILNLIVLSIFTSVNIEAEIPVGYYEKASGKKDADLKTALHEIIKPHNRISYGANGTWTVFRTSDIRSDGSIWDMYSDVVRYFPETGSHSEMHIEHSVPKSWWGEETTFVYEASFDIHHLVPADASTNMSKSNHVLGEVINATFDNGVSKIGSIMIADKKLSAFEPTDEYKGDFARMYMYVATCYQDYTWESDGVNMFNSESYPTLNAYSQDLLMRWHRNDPVSEKEVNRNDAVYMAQFNRNPFIDFPYLAEYLWGDSVGCVFTADVSDYPHLITPTTGDKIDMGAVMVGAVLRYNLDVQGRNISLPLQLAWKEEVGITLSVSALNAVDVNNVTSVTLSYINYDLSDVLRDTLIISGGGMSDILEIPVELRGTTAFIPLQPARVGTVSATLRWVALPDARSYKVELYEGADEASDLFISAYVEGSSYNKALALYNGTSHSVNLSDYALGRQHNGAGEFADYYKLPDKMLAPGTTYILVNSQCDDDVLRGYADFFVPAGETSPLNFNGNDAVVLYHNNIMIDVVGEYNQIENWGKDVTMYRSYSTLGPTTDYSAAQWVKAEKDHFDLLRSHKMTDLTTNAEPIAQIVTDTTEVEVDDLCPSTVYLYKVSAFVGDAEQEAIYGCVFTTLDLSAPTQIYAENVKTESIEIYWNEIDEAVGYEWDCFTLSGSETITVTEGFDNVGSKGTPLPDGWSGTASGNYTSAASSGNAPPSIGLKSSGEYIVAPIYEYPITELSFMYRFASTATGSVLNVTYLKGGEWCPLETIEFVNTSKTICRYTFDRSDEVRAFRFEYSKVSGNMAIDDVTVAYGALDTVYVAREKYVSMPPVYMEDLEASTTYSFRVRSVCGDSRSPWSSVYAVKTSDYTHVDRPDYISDIAYVKCPGGIELINLPSESVVTLYDMQGRLMYTTYAQDTSVLIPNVSNGVFVVKIVNNARNFVIKIVL